jgi:hypothetical protein
MKRAGNLWSAITNFGNLVEAYRWARLGKRFRPDVLAFTDDLEHELLSIRFDLLSRTYSPGPYHQFKILDPKPRLIPARQGVDGHLSGVVPLWRAGRAIADASDPGLDRASRAGQHGHVAAADL